MENFNKFILEVHRLEIKAIERYVINGQYIEGYTPKQVPGLDMPTGTYLSLRHYDQKKSNYESELGNLMMVALNDILALGPEPAKLYINLLKKSEEKFNRFWGKYSEILESVRNGTFHSIDLELKIYPFFNVSNSDKKKFGTITHDFLYDLHDAVMFKSGFISKMKYDLLEILGIDKEESKKSSSKTIDSSPVVLDSLFIIPENIDPAIEVLRQVEPPLISDDNGFLKGPLGGFTIWLNELSKRGIIHNLPKNDASIARMLEAKFKELTIAKDGSSLRKPSIRAEELYKQDIQVLVSQISQSGKIGK